MVSIAASGSESSPESRGQGKKKGTAENPPSHRPFGLAEIPAKAG
jgi:hypothetical protein